MSVHRRFLFAQGACWAWPVGHTFRSKDGLEPAVHRDLDILGGRRRHRRLFEVVLGAATAAVVGAMGPWGPWGWWSWMILDYEYL